MKEQKVTTSGSVTSSHYVNYKFLNPDVLFSTRAKNNIWLNALRAFNQAGKKYKQQRDQDGEELCEFLSEVSDDLQ